MEMKEQKLAVVGCGSFADWMYFPNINKTPGVKCVAACDIIPERARKAADRFGIPAWYPDVQTLIRDCDFDIAIDSASIPAHQEVNMALLRAGKHLISQKPAALTVEKIDEQIAEAKKAGVRFSCVPMHMIRPDILMAKDIISSGAIGRVLSCKCVSVHGGPEYFQYRDADPSWFFEKDAGALYDMGVHALHQVTGIMGPARSVYCMAKTAIPRRTVRSGAFDGKVIQSDKLPDSYYILLDYGEGRMAFVDTGFSELATRSVPLEIFGEKGVISFDPPGADYPYPKAYIDRKELGVRGWMELMSNIRPRPTGFTQCSCLDDMVNAIRNGTEPVLSPMHARHVIEIMCAIPESISTGTAVLLKTEFQLKEGEHGKI